ncbi:unnamed protein product [Closterium sp. NIES-64]|nr:unnamed protein product [Closterium sp. NIES-64]
MGHIARMAGQLHRRVPPGGDGPSAGPHVPPLGPQPQYSAIQYRRAARSPQYSPQLHSDALLRWRAMPGYWPAQAAGFNWTADSRQQAVLLGAKARGVNVFEAFSNSPPWWMTASKDVAGGKKAFQTNLLPKFEGRFAKYLVEVVERFKTDPALGNIELIHWSRLTRR